MKSLCCGLSGLLPYAKFADIVEKTIKRFAGDLAGQFDSLLA
jgi:hypothetical protein